MGSTFYNSRPVRSNASSPRDFKFRDWIEIFKRSKSEIATDNIGIVSAGIAFYAFLGIFPLLAAFVALYGLLASPDDVTSMVNSMSGVIPGDIVTIFETQMTRLVSEDTVAGYAAAISVLVALWSGSKAIKGMMAGLNIAYDEREERNFFKKNGMAMLLTLGGILTGIVTVFLIAALPAIFSFLNLGNMAQVLLQIVRWTLLGALIVTALSVLYRWAPDRKNVSWRWITPGSSLAAIVWLVASGLFSWYVSNFGNYNKTYGSLGAIAILLVWLSLSSYVFLLGAELDSELERQAGMNQKEGKRRVVT
ncbi:MAG: YihY/virulence factor BrkB family protein [Bacteriovoracaceae bacterium]|nr:YihY/virulence factor BrkB family protein [Bacteriovoracaceae bacterium]